MNSFSINYDEKKISLTKQYFFLRKYFISYSHKFLLAEKKINSFRINYVKKKFTTKMNFLAEEINIINTLF